MPSATLDAQLMAEAEERMALRREELKKLCVVRDLRSTDKIEKCFQKAHQIYRQCQVYVVERDFDHAYILLLQLVELYQKKMPCHREFHLARFENERKRLDKKCGDALALLDRILSGMLDEEVTQLQHAHDEDEHILTTPHHHHHDMIMSSEAPAKDAVALALEARLLALKRRNSAASSSSPSVEATSVVQHRERAFDALRPHGSSQSRQSGHHPPLPHHHQAHHLAHFAPPPLTSAAYPSAPQPRAMSKYPSLGGSDVRPSWLSTVDDGQHEHRRSIQSKTQFIRDEVRHMAIPSSLVAEFTRLAASNTSRLPYGVETCGILAGSLKDQRLSITTLIIPKQEGSSDTCIMTHEEDLFEYCIQHDLLTLGWIHTHPSQTCFLSSVDIHTQCGFQSMLSEAIAIVVAPRDPVKKYVADVPCIYGFLVNDALELAASASFG
ncbi:hypothetical protein, variant 1 [Aphanomyces astaci]|uniref:MPN domain-containing protein n=1 Tax=Aphanomyces astaci TaxID=112090 RepID=W4GV25_APHAT|nr:hypothetical protein, variant 1 [Aphanomyces astaci]ETV82773.1 hypothetical protein, variant 1 [Aphanomyces astaci]|eukprot:XP_009827444.1 hypothetical protein, variant 1 [Aphanomyces astaci]